MRYTRYGGPEVLQLVDLPEPTPEAGEIVLRVRACSVNSWDWDKLRGRPLVLRLEGPRRPPHPILGCDVAGEVVAVGPGVTRFAPGDRVFGDISHANWGGFAEFVKAPADALSPLTLPFDQGAALPQAGGLALQGLRQGGLRKGARVLINGAGGGVGTLGVQIAKAAGAHVTCIDRGDKLEMLRDLGADAVIDYQRTDFTEMGEVWDVILDNVAKNRPRAYRQALAPGGRFIFVGGSFVLAFRLGLTGWALNRGDRRLEMLLHHPDTAVTDRLQDMVRDGDLTPVIDQSYSLSETPAALARIGRGDVRGKIIVTP
ncbi:NAD(P)-dependent alcohol dehydrogenase [Aliiroseovarius subalbicans]|nr:NAD(P)-dependent alcohol dehydrogenase [Aliiroseovarius subalbicans]